LSALNVQKSVVSIETALFQTFYKEIYL